MMNTQPAPEAGPLQEILTRMVDSISGLRMAADFSTEAPFIRLCQKTADTREALVEELAAVIAACGAVPSLDGSREASVHRSWIRFVCQIHSKFRHRLRAECERGEREFQRKLRNMPAARNVRTGTLLADLRGNVSATLASLRPLKTPAANNRRRSDYAAA